jgi:hypothetical protein
MDLSKTLQRRDAILSRLPPLIFISVIAYYAALWARVGLNTNDGGFLLALAHRILDGEVPYKDFIFVRPPVSVYLRTIPLLFGDYGLYADRLFTLAQFSVIALAGSKIVKNGIRGLGRECPDALYWPLATAGLILAIHNSPMFGWYTIDGVFFSVLALWALSAKRSMTAGVLALSAALCKQNFVISLGILLVLSSAGGYRRFTRFASSVVACGIAFAGYLWLVDALEPFLRQVFATGTAHDVIDSGLREFVIGTLVDRHTLYGVLITIPIAGVVQFLRRRNAAGIAPRRALGIDLYTTLMSVTLILFGWRVLIKSLRGDSYHYYIAIFHGSRLLFLGAAVGLAWTAWRQWRRSDRSLRALANQWGSFVGLFAIAWTSAISWGYAIPAFLSTPSLVPFVMSGVPSGSQKKRLWLITILSAVAFGIALAHPYGESTRLDRMVSVPERFHGTALLWASRKTVGEFEELDRIDGEMGPRPYAVLPGFTPVSILFHRRSPSLLDWELNAEIPPGLRASVSDHLRQAAQAVIVEKDAALEITRTGRNGRWSSQPTRDVVEHWTCIRELDHFLVYEPPR